MESSVLLGSHVSMRFRAPFASIIHAGDSGHAEKQRVNERQMFFIGKDTCHSGYVVRGLLPLAGICKQAPELLRRPERRFLFGRGNAPRRLQPSYERLHAAFRNQLVKSSASALMATKMRSPLQLRSMKHCLFVRQEEAKLP